jgi:hypothetical protein
MNETIEMTAPVEQAPVKPYTFRKLSADDMFLMFTIIKKIGVAEFKRCFEGEALEALVKTFKNSNGDAKAMTAVGVAVGFDVVDIVLGNLPRCKEEVYQILEQTSNLTVDVIRADALLFTEMVIDFLKKEEFPAFIKVVSKLFR